ncbi:hypothetical protein MNBD_GAMMA11-1072 [hydrothermal vent metagenome]|uniref:Uncharacterized protein n=1 Tax=hydrothermal vent metagenome TaxID=652676 RepID=A0A3B0WTP4_9ZZZZ
MNEYGHQVTRYFIKMYDYLKQPLLPSVALQREFQAVILRSAEWSVARSVYDFVLYSLRVYTLKYNNS